MISAYIMQFRPDDVLEINWNSSICHSIFQVNTILLSTIMMLNNQLFCELHIVRIMPDDIAVQTA